MNHYSWYHAFMVNRHAGRKGGSRQPGLLVPPLMGVAIPLSSPIRLRSGTSLRLGRQIWYFRYLY
jgi:hypothetical protein